MVACGVAAAALGLACTAGAGADEAEGPDDFVRATIVEVVQAVERETGGGGSGENTVDAVLLEVIGPRVDLDRATGMVLGRHWRRASEAQRARFVEEFRVLLARTYAGAVREFVAGARKRTPSGKSVADRLDDLVTFVSTTVSDGGDGATVRTRVEHLGGPALAIEYRLHRRGGRWMVYDIGVEGVSFVVTYRNTFGSLIRRHGLDGLIERIASKNAAADA